jgi:hypothetical protein
LNYYYYYCSKSVILMKRARVANQDGSRNIHDYRMLTVWNNICDLHSVRSHDIIVICVNNVYVNNDYFVNKLSTFVFQNISIPIHCNEYFKWDFVPDIAFAYYNIKMAEQGPLFQVCWGGPKELLKCHCLMYTCKE